MNAKKCDRCGCFYVANTIKKKVAVDIYKDHGWYVIDLCDSCYEELKEFVGFDSTDKEVNDADSN